MVSLFRKTLSLNDLQNNVVVNSANYRILRFNEIREIEKHSDNFYWMILKDVLLIKVVMR